MYSQIPKRKMRIICRKKNILFDCLVSFIHNDARKLPKLNTTDKQTKQLKKQLHFL